MNYFMLGVGTVISLFIVIYGFVTKKKETDPNKAKKVGVVSFGFAVAIIVIFVIAAIAFKPTKYAPANDNHGKVVVKSISVSTLADRQ